VKSFSVKKLSSLALLAPISEILVGCPAFPVASRGAGQWPIM
jgi:hypothetical protein